jgi:hypothetical protein
LKIKRSRAWSSRDLDRIDCWSGEWGRQHGDHLD